MSGILDVQKLENLNSLDQALVLFFRILEDRWLGPVDVISLPGVFEREGQRENNPRLAVSPLKES